MMELKDKAYVVVVQCHIVKEWCPGYLCEKSFHERSGGFSDYLPDKPLRYLALTCGGCCGRAVHRKLLNLIGTIKKKEGIGKEKIGVHLASCITKDNYHGPQCPHLEYLKVLIGKKLKLDIIEGSYISTMSEKLREKGIYLK